MPIERRQGTTGGKGNLRRFTERDQKICAAGIPSAQASLDVKNSLRQYLPKDEVDALVGDAIVPPPKPRPSPPLRKPLPPDTRNSCAFFGEVAELLNPPNKTKFQSLVEDFKETSYSSYWLKPVGQVRDQTPMLPKGFDIAGTTFGKVLGHEDLYDVVMPKIPLPDKTPVSKEPGAKTNRNYCSPPYDKTLTYGLQSFLNKEGRRLKCCLTDDKKVLGTSGHVIMTQIQADFKEAKTPLLGTALTPINNIRVVPQGHAFGGFKETPDTDNFEECLTHCKINEEVEYILQCLKHLNTLRRVLKKRFPQTFFQKLHESLKYFDKEITGWLPKETVYKYCDTKFIRFDSTLIEPLLILWSAFDGSKIEYKTFVHLLNYGDPPPEIPKMSLLDKDCVDYRTTYSEMVKPNQPRDLGPMAGIPSGRYMDLDYPVTPFGLCRAIRTCLPDESDARSCINPSTFTLVFVNHRDMYAVREPELVRRVFEAGYGKFTDERFNTIWEEAKKLHPQGFVCYQTFRQTLEKSIEKKE